MLSSSVNQAPTFNNALIKSTCLKSTNPTKAAQVLGDALTHLVTTNSKKTVPHSTPIDTILSAKNATSSSAPVEPRVAHLGSVVGKVKPAPIDQTTQALQAIAGLKLPVKLQGSWAWISGVQPQHEAPLKAAGFIWSQKRSAWYFSPKPVQPTQNKALHEALKVVKALELSVEVRGAWAWVFGANGAHEAQLRAAGFQWSFKRGLWYFNPKQDKRSSDFQAENGNKIWHYYSGY